MNLEADGLNGLALGAWGAVQATCAGLAIGFGGAIRDIVSGARGARLVRHRAAHPATGYSFVYHIELYLMFATLVVLGPLVRRGIPQRSHRRPRRRCRARPARTAELPQ